MQGVAVGTISKQLPLRTSWEVSLLGRSDEFSYCRVIRGAAIRLKRLQTRLDAYISGLHGVLKHNMLNLLHGISLGVSVAGVPHFEESGAFRRWVSTSRLMPAFRRRSSTVSADLLIDKKTSGSVLLPINLSLKDSLGGQTLVGYGLRTSKYEIFRRSVETPVRRANRHSEH